MTKAKKRSHSCLTRSHDRSLVGWVERSEAQQQIFSAMINSCNIAEPDPQDEQDRSLGISVTSMTATSLIVDFRL